MSMSIRTNVSSLNAQRNLSTNQSQLNNTLNKLSSGYRITKAGDDAAGLAISEKLRSQVSGLNQAVRNANDSVSMIQTAEGGMQEIHSMLQRMNQIATQAANGTLSDGNRGNINTELQALKDEVNAIADRTKFNGMSLLNGSVQGLGADATDTVTNTLLAADIDVDGATGVAALNVDASRSTLAKGTYSLQMNATDNTLELFDGTDVVDSVSFSSLLSAGDGSSATLSFAKAGIDLNFDVTTAYANEADLEGATAKFVGDIEIASKGATATFQIGAEASDTLSVNFDSVKIENGNSKASLAALATALSTFDGATTVDNANALVTAVGSAIDTISSMRSELGAAQNRLDHTIANLGITAENLSASESQIRDADIAEETANMSKGQVLMQAGISVLAQANQQPQMALKLLG